MKANKASISILSQYIDFVDIFLLYVVVKLSKYIKINNYIIKLIENKQLSYRLIYTIELVILETLKTYIKTNFNNYCIRSSKFLTDIFILFLKKPNNNL